MMKIITVVAFHKSINSPLLFDRHYLQNSTFLCGFWSSHRDGFWDVTPCNSAKSNRHFGGSSRLHLQDLNLNQEKKISALLAVYVFMLSFLISFYKNHPHIKYRVFHKLHFPETFDPKYVLPFFNGIFLCSPN
jgi:hypothetical protein